MEIDDKKIKGRDFPLAELSFPCLVEAKGFQGKGDKKFSGTFLIDKTNVEGISLLEEKMENAMTEKFGPKPKWPKRWHNPLRDGDEEKPDQPSYRGKIFVKAQAKEDKRPNVFGPDGDVCDPKDLYPGCWVKASVIAYAYEYMGKAGAGFALKGIQKIKDGRRLDNADVSSEFDSVSQSDGSEDAANYEDVGF